MTRPLQKALLALRAKMPKGSEFVWDLTDDQMVLELFSMPKNQRGQGSLWLARILEAADEYGVTVFLYADPTDQVGDPQTFELVRWYSRFGFEPRYADPEKNVAMERLPLPFCVSADRLLERAKAKKANADLTQEAFEAWLASQDHTPRSMIPDDELYENWQ